MLNRVLFSGPIYAHFMQKLCFIVFLLFSLFGRSQSYPQDYFQSPLTIPLALSGTFGELRSNHFHAGVDIKTQGRQGLPVLAAADGQIVGIKVSAYGYGNCLYIAHPNGYTTVYAHLQSFRADVANWVEQQQYTKQKFEVNLFPPAGKFKVEKGKEIARSGNSGGSGGPHLHFEIRDSKTEEIINPALFGLPILDERKPSIYHLFAEPQNRGSRVNGSNNLREIKLVNKGNGLYTGSFSGNGFIGMIVHTIDKQNLSENKNGVYEIEQFVNDTLNYTFKMERFAFSEKRYINAHIDYARKVNYGQMVHRCFVEPGDKLSVYNHVEKRGLVELKAGQSKQIDIKVQDSWGNISTIKLKATGTNGQTMAEPEAIKLAWNEAHTIKLGDVQLQMSANTLYRDEQIEISRDPACSTCETPVYVIGEKTIPAHKRYSLSIHRSALQKQDRLVWALMDGKGHGSGLTTTWKGDWLTAKPSAFGRFAVMRDTIAPTVHVNLKKEQIVKAGSKISATATDGLSGVTFYQARIDGHWVLLKHDAKRHYYWHEFGDDLAAGQHEIELIFKDEVGNMRSFTSVFSYTSK